MFAFAPSVPVSAARFTAAPAASNKLAAAMPARPVARRATVTKALVDPQAVATLPYELLSAKMEVTFPAYLAVFLGTLIPVAFLVILFIASEARNNAIKKEEE